VKKLLCSSQNKNRMRAFTILVDKCIDFMRLLDKLSGRQRLIKQQTIASQGESYITEYAQFSRKQNSIVPDCSCASGTFSFAHARKSKTRRTQDSL